MKGRRVKRYPLRHRAGAFPVRTSFVEPAEPTTLAGCLLVLLRDAPGNRIEVKPAEWGRLIVERFGSKWQLAAPDDVDGWAVELHRVKRDLANKDYGWWPKGEVDPLTPLRFYPRKRSKTWVS